MSVVGQSRRIAPQKNSEPFRTRPTAKDVTDRSVEACYVFNDQVRVTPNGASGVDQHCKAEVCSRAQRCDDLVAPSARAAGRTDTRIGVLTSLLREIRLISAAVRGIPARAAAIGLDRRPQRAHFDYRLPAGNPADMHEFAAELVALAPDVILATGARLGAVAAGDPHRSDRVRGRPRSGRRRLCREPGAAGRQRHRLFEFEYSLCGKWLELLKEIAPGVTRAAVLRDPAIAAGISQFAVIQPAAPSLAWR